MGVLEQFNCSSLISHYGCRFFVETGTGIGISMHYAATLPFTVLHSCEIDSDLAKAAQMLFQDDPRIHIHSSTSEAMLRAVLPTLPQDKPAAFWLDAHFPGADYTVKSYMDEKNEDLRLPLERELILIKQARPNAGDVILIDDLRIYEEGTFGSGPCPPSHSVLKPEHRNIDFVFHLFGESHNVTRHYENEGYLSLTPKRVALPKSVADCFQLALDYQRQNQPTHTVRILEQILWHNIGDDRIFSFIGSTIVDAAKTDVALASLIAPALQLVQQAAQQKWPSIALVGVGLDACLTISLAHQLGITISCVIDDNPQLRNNQIAGLPLYTLETALQNQAQNFLIASSKDEAKLTKEIETTAKAIGKQIRILGLTDLTSSAP